MTTPTTVKKKKPKKMVTVSCPRCRGAGMFRPTKDARRPVECPDCSGGGEVQQAAAGPKPISAGEALNQLSIVKGQLDERNAELEQSEKQAEKLREHAEELTAKMAAQTEAYEKHFTEQASEIAELREKLEAGKAGKKGKK